MMKLAALTTFAVLSKAETIVKFMTTTRDDEFSKTRVIAQTMDIDSLVANLSGFTLFLPTNAAWEANPAWYAKACADTDLAADLIFSAAASIPACTGNQASWECVVGEAEVNFNLIDTAYGTSYYVLPDKVCIAEFTDWYHPDLNKCTKVLEPQQFNDAVVFPITDLNLIPPPLEAQLED